LSAARADFLAQHFGAENDQGGISLVLDPAHRHINPVQYRIEEAMACWRRVTAPVLWVTASDSYIFPEFFPLDSDDHSERRACFRNLKWVHLKDSSHNMHHDQPEAIARLIEEFVS
jgi:pimeloyl-ACP methyl ester carboxylesterase